MLQFTSLTTATATILTQQIGSGCQHSSHAQSP